MVCEKGSFDSSLRSSLRMTTHRDGREKRLSVAGCPLSVRFFPPFCFAKGWGDLHLFLIDAERVGHPAVVSGQLSVVSENRFPGRQKPASEG